MTATTVSATTTTTSCNGELFGTFVSETLLDETAGLASSIQTKIQSILDSTQVQLQMRCVSIRQITDGLEFDVFVAQVDSSELQHQCTTGSVLLETYAKNSLISITTTEGRLTMTDFTPVLCLQEPVTTPGSAFGDCGGKFSLGRIILNDTLTAQLTSQRFAGAATADMLNAYWRSLGIQFEVGCMHVSSTSHSIYLGYEPEFLSECFKASIMLRAQANAVGILLRTESAGAGIRVRNFTASACGEIVEDPDEGYFPTTTERSSYTNNVTYIQIESGSQNSGTSEPSSQPVLFALVIAAGVIITIAVVVLMCLVSKRYTIANAVLAKQGKGPKLTDVNGDHFEVDGSKMLRMGSNNPGLLQSLAGLGGTDSPIYERSDEFQTELDQFGHAKGRQLSAATADLLFDDSELLNKTPLQFMQEYRAGRRGIPNVQPDYVFAQSGGLDIQNSRVTTESNTDGFGGEAGEDMYAMAMARSRSNSPVESTYALATRLASRQDSSPTYARSTLQVHMFGSPGYNQNHRSASPLQDSFYAQASGGGKVLTLAPSTPRASEPMYMRAMESVTSPTQEESMYMQAASSRVMRLNPMSPPNDTEELYQRARNIPLTPPGGGESTYQMAAAVQNRTFDLTSPEAIYMRANETAAASPDIYDNVEDDGFDADATYALAAGALREWVGEHGGPGPRTGTMGTMDSRISGLSFHSLNSYREFDIDPNPLSPEPEGYEAIGGAEEPGRLVNDRESEG